MRFSKRVFASVAMALTLLVGASAQPGPYSVASVELRALRAETIILGVVTDEVDRTTSVSGNPYQFGPEITISVQQILKGEALHPENPIHLKVGFGRGMNLPYLRDLKKRGAHVLAFIGPGDTTYNDVYQQLGDSIIDLDAPKVQFDTANFKTITDAKAGVQYVIDTLKHNKLPAPVRPFYILADRSKEGREWLKHHIGAGSLAVPMDEKIVRNAQRELRQINDPLAVYDGWQVIQYYKTDENIAILKWLLTSKFKWPTYQIEFNRGLQLYRYDVRQAAYDHLTQWGVAVEKPVLIEAKTDYNAVKEAMFYGAYSKHDLEELLLFKNLNAISFGTQMHTTVQPLTDEEIKWIADFKNVKRLKLSGMKSIKDSNLALFLPLSNLQSLDLSDTRVTNASLPILGQFKNLTELNVDKTEITDDAVAEFTATHPLVKVIPDHITSQIDDYAKVGNLNAVKRILEANPKVIEQPDRDGNTPLGIAASQGRLEVARYLLDHGAKVDATDNSGQTPLIQEAWYNTNLDLAKLLIERGADVNHRTKFGVTAMQAAANGSFRDLIMLLSDHGARINSRNDSGATPISYTASNIRTNIEALKLMVNRGADINAADNNGETPLSHLLWNASYHDTMVFLGMGANPLLKKKNGKLVTEEVLANPQSRAAVEAFVALLKNPIQLVKQSKAYCRNLAYATSPNSSLTQTQSRGIGSTWESQNLGALAGDLKWSVTPSGRPYIGPFGQQAVTLSLSNLPVHKHISVDIDLFVMGSWDGNTDGEGPDIMDISVPGVGTLLHSTFYNNTLGEQANLPLQSFPDPYPFGFHKGYTGAAEVRTLGIVNIAPGDAVYKLHFSFDHAGKDFALVLKGLTVPQGGITRLEDDETWGVGGLTVRTD